jgi:Zn-dependent protease with chaperone function
MNFFEHQDQARQQTKKLMALFAASVLTLVLGVYFAALLTLGQAAPSLLGGCQATLPETGTIAAAPAMELFAAAPQITDAPPQLLARRVRYGRSRSLSCQISGWWQPHILFGVGTVTTAIIGLASLWKINQLKAGGHVVAESLGGRLLDSNSNDAQERMLLNVVEEMAIAAGTPVPGVYLLDQEYGINAFAAGFTPNDAVIGVTRGSLEQFNRDELQGVIGHEFSHILNGDMRMNITLMGWLHGILCIYLIGRGILQWGRNDRDGNGLGLFGLALIGLGSSGLFFGRLIQSAISRQREYLADASAVQFTRNPQGIASALEKVGGSGSKINASYAQASSHMFFGSVLSNWWSADWFATHPPIGQRIMRVQGLNVGDLAGVSESAASVSGVVGAMGFASAPMNSPVKTPAKAAAKTSAQNPFQAPARTPAPQAAPPVQSPVQPPVQPSVQPSAWTSAALPESVITTSPEQVITQIGTVDPSHYDYAKGLLAQIPSDFRSALRDPRQAGQIIYALMLDRENPFTYQNQVTYLQQVEDAAGIEQIFQFHAQLKTLNPRLYLPMLDLAVPALRQRSPQDCQRLLKAVHELAKSDGQWTLAEFVSYLVLQYRLQPHITQPTQPTIDYKDIAPVWNDCLKIIAALAKIGSQEPNAIDFAFRSGLSRLPNAGQNPSPADLPPCNLIELRASLEKLRRVTPKLKQGIVDACSLTVMVDNRITTKEADLLRAIVILLDCPLPPFLDSDRFAAD